MISTPRHCVRNRIDGSERFSGDIRRTRPRGRHRRLPRVGQQTGNYPDALKRYTGPELPSKNKRHDDGNQIWPMASRQRFKGPASTMISRAWTTGLRNSTRRRSPSRGDPDRPATRRDHGRRVGGQVQFACSRTTGVRRGICATSGFDRYPSSHPLEKAVCCGLWEF